MVTKQTFSRLQKLQNNPNLPHIYMLDCVVMHMRNVNVRRTIEGLKVQYTTWVIAIIAAKS